MAKHSFRGGIHPYNKKHEGKDATRNDPIRPFVSDAVTIPMGMHIGAPSEVCVSVGERVRIGQLIGKPVGALGLPVHASIAGKVTAIEPKIQFGPTQIMTVSIENDFSEEWVELSGLGSVETADPSLIVPAIKNAGICGMGGATFPTHIKLTIPEGKRCDTIIVNGSECETHLTSDYRLMLETPARVVDGLRAAMRALDVKRGVIAIEDNKKEAIEAMKCCAAEREGVEVFEMPTKYPQGGEKQLIKAVTGHEVPARKLPIDVNTVVINAATAAAIADAVTDGRPLIERVVTVTGCVSRPGNLLIRTGTVFADVIGACDGYSEDPGKIIAGGGMTGPCAPDDTVSSTKGCSGILVLNMKEAKTADEQPCIRCGHCVEVCPIGLDPFLIKYYCDQEDFEGAKRHHVMECIMCGCCAYICPSRRWLTTSFSMAKRAIAAEAKGGRK